MKKKNSLKVLAVLLIVFIYTLPFSVFAAETTLTTTVPSEFSMKIEIIGSGCVSIGGKSYFNNTEIKIPRHEESLFSVRAEKSFLVKAVLLNGEDVTEKLENGTFSFLPEANAELQVFFEKDSEVPKTGDNHGMFSACAIFMISVLAMVILAAWKKRI